jgi:hypothetical protein
VVQTVGSLFGQGDEDLDTGTFKEVRRFLLSYVIVRWLR